MKANEALENMYIPKKIYLPYKDGKVIGLVKETGVPYKSGVDGNIEYTRTDAFVEKATEYLKEHLIDYWSQGVTDESKFVDEFRKYMQGE